MSEEQKKTEEQNEQGLSGEQNEKASQEEPNEKALKEKPKAAARPKATPRQKKETEEEKPREPSKNQPLLDKYVQVIKNHFEDDVIEDAYINWLAKEVPTLVIKKERWFDVAQFIKHNEQLAFDYLSHLAGSDHETHLEVYYQFYSYKEKQMLAVKVKTDREEATIPSVTPIWPGANWPEREAYDLVGIRFTNHPDLRRILLTDEWVGHPLRKDYEPYDEGI